MKKVEDYFKDGCVFVQGDSVESNCYMYDTDYNPVSWVMYINKGCCDWHTDKIDYFTWRNSTGTPPTYTNLVEVKQRNGTVYVDYVKNIDFTLELSDDDVVQWKPYIECELDWHLGGYSKFVNIKVNIGTLGHLQC